jgi:hypothetical protein
MACRSNMAINGHKDRFKNGDRCATHCTLCAKSEVAFFALENRECSAAIMLQMHIHAAGSSMLLLEKHRRSGCLIASAAD